MKQYKIPVTFTFKGNFFIKANSKKEAIEFADKHCGMTVVRGIHSSLPDEDVDWNFPVHPKKEIILGEKS
jgi:hypothetical protein